MSNLQQKICDWYVSQYPDDEVGYDIDSSATFDMLIPNLGDIYPYLGVTDSIVRERVFVELSNRTGLSYDSIYLGWLNS